MRRPSESLFVRFLEFFGEPIKADFEETQWCFNLDVPRVVDCFVTGLQLKVCCPESWVVIILVPAKIHDIVNPVDTLNVSTLSRPPKHFHSRLCSWERLAEEQFHVGVRDNSPWTESSGLIPDIVESRNVFHSFLETTKAFTSGESSTTSEKDHHLCSYPSCGSIVESLGNDSPPNVVNELRRLIAS